MLILSKIKWTVFEFACFFGNLTFLHIFPHIGRSGSIDYRLQVGCLGILLLDIAMLEIKRSGKFLNALKKLNKILQSLTRPAIVVAFFDLFLQIKIWPLSALEVKPIVLFLVVVFSSFQLAKQRYKSIETASAKLGSIVLITLGNNFGCSLLAASYHMSITERTSIHILNVGVLVFLIYYLLNQWGFQLPHWKLSLRSKKIWLGILCTPLIITMLCNLKVSGRSSLGLNDLNFLATLEVGVEVLFEEWLFRLTFLDVFFDYFKRDKPVVIWFGMISSGLLFGLYHFTNLNFSSATLGGTINQVVVACFLGFFLAGVYLYSNTIWLPILLHFGVDFFGADLSELTDGANTTENTGIQLQQFSEILLIAYLILLAFISSWYLVTKGYPVVLETVSTMHKKSKGESV